MRTAYLNSIITAVPDEDIHAKFVAYCPKLLPDEQSIRLFKRMAQRAQIDHRYSFLKPDSNSDQLDRDGFYKRGNFPSTRTRMEFYRRHAFSLARKALDQIDLKGVTHIILTTCTGFYAPGLDLEIIKFYNLPASVERTVVGFMGCYAALNALKLARHIVRSETDSTVLVLNLELCTLHLQEQGSFEQMLSFLIFGDGCAASIVSSEANGIRLDNFGAMLIQDSDDHITWEIGELGFDMNLSGHVPGLIARALSSGLDTMLGRDKREDIAFWAIHSGGRSILDAVKEGAGLDENHLRFSRDILRRYGNMSSATIMFVLNEILQNPGSGGTGLAMAFGPGLGVETMKFSVAGSRHA